jgi:ribosomal protein L3 glutamine methyltransferase
MTISFKKLTKTFTKPVDFIRLGVTSANQEDIYYGHGTDNAWDDMLTLVFSSLAIPLDSHESFLMATLSEEECALLTDRLHARINKRVPVPYLTKEAYFCDLSFYVDERVLIPRSPISELIQSQFAPWVDADQVTRVLDLCTGSGCIAIACGYAFPEAIIDAVDISKDALAVAQINVEDHGQVDQTNLIESDCFDNVPNVTYDLIVSNPPYVGAEEMKTLPDEYRHEPTLALETENNGLSIVEKILKQAHHYLNDEGVLVVEVGNSEEALIDAYPDVPFTWLDFEAGGHGIFLLTKEQLLEWF